MAKKRKEKRDWNCYTFPRTLHFGEKTFVKWKKIWLTDEEAKTLENYVVLTSDYITSEGWDKDCGCK